MAIYDITICWASIIALAVIFIFPFVRKNVNTLSQQNLTANKLWQSNKCIGKKKLDILCYTYRWLIVPHF